ncbi:MAG: hypothetical protein R2822_25065 [Spirosomataceae bacterium]
MLRISIFIPGPVIAMCIATLLSATVFAGKGLVLVKDLYGSIPNNFFVFTAPSLPEWNVSIFIDILYFVGAIVFLYQELKVFCSSIIRQILIIPKRPLIQIKNFLVKVFYKYWYLWFKDFLALVH